jgi:hypothetical protein
VEEEHRGVRGERRRTAASGGVLSRTFGRDCGVVEGADVAGDRVVGALAVSQSSKEAANRDSAICCGGGDEDCVT